MFLNGMSNSRYPGNQEQVPPLVAVKKITGLTNRQTLLNKTICLLSRAADNALPSENPCSTARHVQPVDLSQPHNSFEVEFQKFKTELQLEKTSDDRSPGVARDEHTFARTTPRIWFGDQKAAG